MITKLVLQNFKHRPIRTFLTVLAIGLQVTLVLTIVGLSRGLIDADQTRTRGVGADILVRPPGAAVIGINGSPMPEKLVDLIEKQSDVAVAQGIVLHPIEGLEVITGIDIDTFDRMSGGLDYHKGGAFQTPNDILVDTNYADQHKLDIGSTIELANHKWTVRGIVRPGKLSKIFAQKHVLQDLTSSDGRITMVYVKLRDTRTLANTIATFKQLLDGYQIHSMDEFLSLITPDTVPGLNAFIATIVGLAVVFGFLVVFLAMYTAVLERTREIGILKALGASAGYIIGMLMRETILLAVIGSAIGIALSYLAKWALTSFVPSSLPVVAVPDWWFRAALISLAGAMLGAIYPGTKAVRQDTIEALAYE